MKYWTFKCLSEPLQIFAYGYHSIISLDWKIRNRNMVRIVLSLDINFNGQQHMISLHLELNFSHSMSSMRSPIPIIYKFRNLLFYLCATIKLFPKSFKFPEVMLSNPICLETEYFFNEPHFSLRIFNSEKDILQPTTHPAVLHSYPAVSHAHPSHISLTHSLHQWAPAQLDCLPLDLWVK